MARGRRPSTTRFQRAVPLPTASPQGGLIAAHHPKEDILATRAASHICAVTSGAFHQLFPAPSLCCKGSAALSEGGKTTRHASAPATQAQQHTSTKPQPKHP